MTDDARRYLVEQRRRYAAVLGLQHGLWMRKYDKTFDPHLMASEYFGPALSQAGHQGNGAKTAAPEQAHQRVALFGHQPRVAARVAHVDP